MLFDFERKGKGNGSNSGRKYSWRETLDSPLRAKIKFMLES